jgi:hypothetical protein
MGAVLACGDGALLSHRSAAALWGLATSAATRADVTAIGRSRYGLAGITLHQVRGLHPEDRAVADGIPVTTVARTLLDLAEVVRPDRLERAFEEAERLRVLDMSALTELCERSRGRRGLKAIRPLLERRTRPRPGTRSELERDWERDAQLQLTGHRVVRLTARRLADESSAVIETIRSLLQAAP